MLLALAFVAAIILGSVAIHALRSKSSQVERIISTLTLLAALVTLILATWQNQIAASDSKESAKAADLSAQAALQSLTIEQSPALVINCESGAIGKETAVLPLVPNDRFELPIEVAWPRESIFNYETCVVHNFGRQPVISAVLPITYEFYRVHSAGHAVTLGRKTISAPLSGIAAQGSYILWVENKSIRSFVNLLTPTSILFFEPSLPRKQLKFVFPRSVKYTVTILNPAHLPPSSLNEPFFQNMQ